MKRGWIALVLALVVLGAYYLVLGRSHLQEIGRLHAEIHRLYDSAPSMEDQHAHMQRLTESVEQLEAWRDELRSQLALREAAPPFLLRATADLQSFGLEAERAEILPDEERLFANQRVQVVVCGEFSDLFRFIHHLEATQPPSRVTSLEVSMAADGKNVRADLSLVSFWGPDS